MMASMDEPLSERVREVVVLLLHELVDGPPGREAYALNPGDRGLLASLDRLSAEEASARPQDRSSIASHVDHLRYGFELLNRWTRGENPWRDADFSPSWTRQTVNDEGWKTLRGALRREAHDWIAAVGRERPLDRVALGGVLGSVVHLGYHLGAIRQLSRAAAGPRDPGRPE
jgi:hypothetical protein